MYIYTGMYICIYTCIYFYKNVYIYIYMYTCTNIYTYTETRNRSGVVAASDAGASVGYSLLLGGCAPRISPSPADEKLRQSEKRT